MSHLPVAGFCRGDRVKLAETCQLVLFDPTLLSCAKKRGVEPPRRSCFRCAYRATEQKGCDPFDIPGVLISNCYPVERFYGFRQHSRSGLQLQTSLQLVQRSTCRAANMAVPTAARHFCSAKILAGRAALGDGGPQRRGCSSRAKKFPEEICFAPSRVLQVCRTLDQQPLKSTKQCPTRKISIPGSPGISQGSADPCVFTRQRKIATSSRRLDTVIDAQIKSVGSKKNQLAGLCQTP